MSKITVANIDTENGTTPLNITTGSSNSGFIKIESANGDVVFGGNAKFIRAIPGLTDSFITANLAFDKANSANILAFDTGLGANNFARATIAGANSLASSIVAANATATGTAANTFAATIVSANASTIGIGANAFTSATVRGANTIANLAFDRANSANYYTFLVDANVKAAFAKANTGGTGSSGGGLIGNTVILTGASPDIKPLTNSYFFIELTADTTFTINTQSMVANTAYPIYLQIENPNNYTYTFPDSVRRKNFNFLSDMINLVTYNRGNIWYTYTDYPSRPWDIRDATYTSKRFVTNSIDDTPQTMFIRPEGNTVYFVGSQRDNVYQLSLSTNWDISTASYTTFFRFNPQEATPQGIAFRPEGNAMYMSGTSNDSIFQYTLSTEWNVATATYTDFRANVQLQDTSPQGIAFRPEGNAMYIMGGTTDTVYQYTLGTAWNVATATYDNKSFSVTAQEASPQDVYFKYDGSTMYVVGTGTDQVIQYRLTTAWDVSTAQFQNSFAPGAGNLQGIFFKPDGRILYVVSETSTGDIRQYEL